MVLFLLWCILAKYFPVVIFCTAFIPSMIISVYHNNTSSSVCIESIVALKSIVFLMLSLVMTYGLCLAISCIAGLSVSIGSTRLDMNRSVEPIAIVLIVIASNVLNKCPKNIPINMNTVIPSNITMRVALRFSFIGTLKAK